MRAYKTLQLQSQKMLASTVQFSTYDQTPTHTSPPNPPAPQAARRYENRTALTETTTTPVTRGVRSLRTQQRAYDRPTPHRPRSTRPRRDAVLGAGRQPAGRTGQRSTLEHHPRHPRPPGDWATVTVLGAALDHHRNEAGRPVLLRKEVIQPHLPVRLPCYDFVPIADPAFDGSLPQGVGPPASGVTDFRDVTGGVYKARERIHRSVADLRLLATPTSWGRVADPNPN